MPIDKYEKSTALAPARGRTIPTLAGYISADGRYVYVLCEYCERLHTHSAGDGHRVAHCDRGTPYRDAGYYIYTVQRLAPGERVPGAPRPRRAVLDESSPYYRRRSP
jgi:hypothetical protein